MRARELMRWEVWSIAVWMAFGIMNGTQVVTGMRGVGMQHPWGRLFIAYALHWAVWAVVSPLIIELGRRISPARQWYVHLAAFTTIVIVHGAWSIFLGAVLQPYGPSGPLNLMNDALSFFYSRFHLDVIAYAGVLLFGHLIESQRRLAMREEQLAKARLDALVRQLEPHFLFNTLNAMAALVRSGQNGAAVDMIVGLSDLLRRVVDGPPGNETSLAEEIEFLQSYLRIQKLRFAERLRVDVDVPGELWGARVPSMILQPMVENAIKHGVGTRVEGGSIRISARRVNGLLRMSVENDGPAITAVREGVGVANTRARLRSMYGDTGGFELHNNGAGAVEAVVTVPYLAMT
jgi:two-component system LytT family sensor kinase